MISLENANISRRRLDRDRCEHHLRTNQSLGILDQLLKNSASLDPDHLVILYSEKLALTLPCHHASGNE